MATIVLIIASASIGQCYQRQSYGGYVQQYAAPVYQQQYQAQTYFAADPGYFASQVAAYTKKVLAEQAAVKLQTDLLSRLAAIEAKLNQPDPTPVQTSYQVQASPQQPLQLPRAPDKSPPPQYGSPQSPTYGIPQTPDKSPPPASYGSPQAPQYQAAPPDKEQPEASYGGQPTYGARPSLPMADVPQPPTVGQASAIGPVLARGQCLNCHSGSSAPRGIVLDDPDSLDVATRIAVYRAVRDGRMPPSPRPHVAPGDLIQFKAWVRDALSDVALNLR